jgi:arginase
MVTLGGECSVSIVPFNYLTAKYKNDIAIVCMDAHPDITLPGNANEGDHAMALTTCFGMGDNEIMSLLPGRAKLTEHQY